jgi:predicted nucleotidyltransferase
MFLDKTNIVGLLLVIGGLLLLPVFIGIPILVSGLLLLVFNFYKNWFDFFVPKEVSEKMIANIKESYKPHQPALTSLKTIGIDMLKIALIVFVIIIVLTGILFFFR